MIEKLENTKDGKFKPTEPLNSFIQKLLKTSKKPSAQKMSSETVDFIVQLP